MALLLDYYKNMWNNTEVAKKYWQCGAQDFGNILWFMNTNFRTIAPAFYNAYIELKSEVGHTASEFEVVFSHGQSKAKQYTVRMRQMWLYYIDENSRYQLSKRGKVFEKAMSSNELSEAEKDLLCYLFLLVADFNTTAKYLFNRTRECFNYYHNAGYTTNEILALQKDFLHEAANNGVKVFDLAKKDYFYIANLYRPYRQTDFLKVFQQSTTEDKIELKRYVQHNIQNHLSRCILSKKFETSGNFNKPMIVECAWILYLTKKIQLLGAVSYDEFISSIVQFYGDIFTIRNDRILSFISENRDIFETIYNILYNVVNNNEQGLLTEEEINGTKVIDPTDIQGQARQNQVSEALKLMAKEKSNYHCILEDSEDCAEHYFTSKTENQNYVEVHHFIPREFASEFEHSIEILDNYVTLCPCCHRKIHHAIDRERKHMILEIYNKRKDLLEQDGIHIPDKQKLFQFYKFEQTID